VLQSKWLAKTEIMKHSNKLDKLGSSA